MSFLMLLQIPLEFCPLCNNSPAIISGTPQFFIRHVNNAGGKWNCLWRLISRLTGRQGRCVLSNIVYMSAAHCQPSDTCLPQVPWSNSSFAIALTYINWETDAIVGVELLQNVGIAIVCIFVTTLITLGNIFRTVFTSCTTLNLVGKQGNFLFLYHSPFVPHFPLSSLF